MGGTMTEAGGGVLLAEGGTMSCVGTSIDNNSDVGLGIQDSTATINECTISGTRFAHDGEAIGIAVQGGSSLVAEGCIVERNAGFGVTIKESVAELSDCIVRETTMAESGQYGRGVSVSDGALRVVGGTIRDNHEIGLFVSGYGASAHIESVVITNVQRSLVANMAAGVVSQEGAMVSADHVEVSGVEGLGLHVSMESYLHCGDCEIAENSYAGAVAQAGGYLSLEDTTLRGTRRWLGDGGVGVLVIDDYSEMFGQPSLTMTGGLIEDNPLAGVFLRGAGTHILTSNEISGGNGVEVSSGHWAHGDALFATPGESGAPGVEGSLIISGNVLKNSAGAGVFLNAATATLSGNSYQGNSKDILVQSCTGVTLPEGLTDETASTTEICPEYDYLTQDLYYSVYLTEPEVKKAR